MKTKFINSTEINSTIIDMYIKPSRSRTNDNDTAKLNFTWDTLSYENQFLTIQLNFEHPYDISMTEIYDELVVNMKERSFFISEEYLTDLNDTSRVLIEKIVP